MPPDNGVLPDDEITADDGVVVLVPLSDVTFEVKVTELVPFGKVNVIVKA